MTRSTLAPKKIAVLGGGMSSLVTAFELTNLPNARSDYEITVYQQGWRLGGKGASGRNRDQAMRIEEHGLHVLFGCYENAFRVLRKCYRELPPAEPSEKRATIEDAFKPHDSVVMFENFDGIPRPWELRPPRRKGSPGIGGEIPFGPMNYLRLILEWVEGLGRGLLGGERGAPDFSEVVGVRETMALIENSSEGTRSMPEDPLAALSSARKLAAGLSDPNTFNAIIQEDQSARAGEGLIQTAYRRIAGGARGFADFVKTSVAGAGDEIRRLRVISDFAASTVRGFFAAGVVGTDAHRPQWFAIDDYDLRAWLRANGAAEETLESPLIQGLYDSVFTAGELSAAAIMHAAARASHYKGAFVYKMQGGMGDVIFAPLYRTLKDRGVKFEFFHRVEKLELSSGRTHVEKIVLDRQVRLKAETYEPLIRVDGMWCWPSSPRLEQLATDLEEQDLDGQDLENWWHSRRGEERQLARGVDFDEIVLGISVGALGDICGDLLQDPENPAFKVMVNSVRTTQTQAAQLWLRKSLEELGWNRRETIGIPFSKPFDTWADMSHLIEREQWPDDQVKTIIYLCTNLDDRGHDHIPRDPPPRDVSSYPAEQADRVRANLERWLAKEARLIWPGAFVDGAPGIDASILTSLYSCATVHPSDRYVLATPRSHARRLAAHESGYENLWLTGDWTRTAMSIGCLEGATMAGIQAARAIAPAVERAAYDWLDARPQENLRTRAAEPSQAQYCFLDGEMLVEPPIGLDMAVDVFVVPARYSALEWTCRPLNLFSPVAYAPLGSFVMFYCARMVNKTAAGSIDELDFGIWIPVLGGETAGGSFAPNRLLLYSPYVWVDNSPALVGGRSIFGFPKHLASLSLPEPAEERGAFGVSTWLMPERNTKAVHGKLLEIRPTTAARAAREPVSWQTGIELFRDVTTLIKDIRLCPQVKTGTWLGLLPLLANTSRNAQVFFKQVPGTRGDGAAVYQAVLEAPFEQREPIRGGLRSGEYEILLRNCASHKIAETLGLKSGERVTLEGAEFHAISVSTSFWFQFSGEVGIAEVLGERR